MRGAGVLLILVFMIVATACTGEEAETQPIPTSSTFFEGENQNSQGVASPSPEVRSDDNAADLEELPVASTSSPGALDGPEANADNLPTRRPLNVPSPSPLPQIRDSRVTTRTVFADSLADAWTLTNSRWVAYTRTMVTTHRGDYALQFKPQEDFGKLYFTVTPTATTTFSRAQTLGVRFWLQAGSDPLPLESLAVTVTGSNEYTYWVEGDNSVTNVYEPVFSETSLHFLNLKKPIPPNTWALVELWLNDLAFDPPYDYVTGFYLKNDRGVFRTMLIDDVQLITAREP